MLTLILGLPAEVKARYDLRSLRQFIVSSAPVMTRTKEEAVRTFAGVRIFEGYGSTETGSVTVLQPAEQLRKERSIGRPTVGKEIRLLDDHGDDVKPGEIGELYVRGLGVLFSEYWKNPRATAEAFRGDWCTVGDMARMDEEGYLYLEDRKKDMIISGGENVYPTEVENVLVRHPAVAEVAVVGVPDERWGERVHAVIVPREGAQVALQGLLDFCRDKLAGYKRPKSLDLADSLPKSATGKILRRKVREACAGGRNAYGVVTGG
jgi:long-chain acyl-CoA synthetase